jgi:hypothetical protein
MSSRETPLPTHVIIFLPYAHQLDLKQMIAGFVPLLAFLCSPGFVSLVQAAVLRGCVTVYRTLQGTMCFGERYRCQTKHQFVVQ